MAEGAKALTGKDAVVAADHLWVNGEPYGIVSVEAGGKRLQVERSATKGGKAVTDVLELKDGGWVSRRQGVVDVAWRKAGIRAKDEGPRMKAEGAERTAEAAPTEHGRARTALTGAEKPAAAPLTPPSPPRGEEGGAGAGVKAKAGRRGRVAEARAMVEGRDAEADRLAAQADREIEAATTRLTPKPAPPTKLSAAARQAGAELGGATPEVTRGRSRARIERDVADAEAGYKAVVRGNPNTGLPEEPAELGAGVNVLKAVFGRWRKPARLEAEAKELAKRIVPPSLRGRGVELVANYLAEPEGGLNTGLDVLLAGHNLTPYASVQETGAAEALAKTAARKLDLSRQLVKLAATMRLSEQMQPGVVAEQMAKLGGRDRVLASAMERVARLASGRSRVPEFEALVERLGKAYSTMGDWFERTETGSKLKGYDSPIYVREHGGVEGPVLSAGTLTPRTTTSRARHRERYPTFMHALAAATRGEVKLWSTDAVALLGRYADEVLPVVVNRRFLERAATVAKGHQGLRYDVAQGYVDQYGNPMITNDPDRVLMLPDPATGKLKPTRHGYKRIEARQFAYRATTPEGKVPQELYATPAVADFLNEAFAPSPLRSGRLKPLFWASSHVKRLNVLAGPDEPARFATALLMSAHNSGTPWAAYRLGGRMMREGEPLLNYLIAHGLTMHTERNWPVSIGGEPHSKWNVMARVEAAWEKALYQRLAAFFKATDATEAMVEQMRLNPKADPDRIAQEVARSANLRYGGLDYARMKIPATTRDFVSLGVFAPDWTMANLYLVRDLLPWAKDPVTGEGKLTPERSRIAAETWLRIIARTVVVSQAVNMLLNQGKTTAENPLVKRDLRDLRMSRGPLEKVSVAAKLPYDMLAVNVTPLVQAIEKYLPEEMRTNPQDELYVELGRQYTDPARFAVDPRRFVKGKMNPLASGVASLATGWSREPGEPATMGQMFPRGWEHLEDILTGRGRLQVPEGMASKEYLPTLPARLIVAGKESVVPIVADQLLGMLLGYDAAASAALDVAGLKVRRGQRNAPPPKPVRPAPPRWTRLGKMLQE